MNCRSAESLFSSFLEDELSQEERRSLESHVMGCRRCSLAVKELRASLALLAALPSAATSPHFEEEIMDRIRSGEALRPSLVDWLGGFFTPERLRPVFLGGAAVCAMWIAVIVARPGSDRPSGDLAQRATETVPAPAAEVRTDESAASPEPVLGPKAALASTSPSRASGAADRAPKPAETPSGEFLWADSEFPVASFASDSTLPNPGARYQDEYILDQFYLDRGDASGTHSIVPVSGRASDDVYITF